MIKGLKHKIRVGMETWFQKFNEVWKMNFLRIVVSGILMAHPDFYSFGVLQEKTVPDKDSRFNNDPAFYEKGFEFLFREGRCENPGQSRRLPERN